MPATKNRFKRIVVFSLTFALAGAAIAQNPGTSSHTPGQQTPQELKLMLLKGEVEEKEIEWLGENNTVLALWRQETTGKPFGAILMLHDDGQHPDWPRSIHPVRINLTQYGWSTLSISMPETANRTVPPRPEPTPKPKPKPKDNTEPAEDEEKTEAESAKAQKDAEETAKLNQRDTEVDEEAQKIEDGQKEENTPKTSPEILAAQRIEAGINFLNDRGQFNVIVIAYGVSAFRAMSLIDDLTSGNTSTGRNLRVRGKVQRPVRAMIMVNARNSIKTVDQNITDFFDHIEIPILDIYFDNYYLEEMESLERKTAARQYNVDNYYQQRVAIPTHNVPNQDSFLSRRVRGFLNKHAKGVKVDN